ncbi:hypothetical protein VP01_551g9 [Puccinia sorghi]|uniref:Retrovirus-related Pol polyprotein from transposon TNT 1-94-like beta-barrel domain-containing protein n=1 Tax=Puccinia sorghi TaxID=27349 RepID=A0A0L6UJE8_9BASI|nr:hypothetical protein VP01_551g9 [Puccinia sorghi]
MTDKTATIPSLEKISFASWKRTIEGYCLQHGLWKHLTSNKPPAGSDAAATLLWEEKHEKTAGILQLYMGDSNYNRLKVAKINTLDSSAVWSFLKGHYESKSVDNQSKVYQDYLAFSYKSDLKTFIDELDTHLSALSAVGVVISETAGDIKESLFAESIVAKLPKEFEHSKDLIFSKRPLSIAIVKDALENKYRDSSSTSTSVKVKSEDTALAAKGSSSRRPFCSNGVHNPETKHPESKCRELKKKPTPKEKARLATANDSDNESSTSYGTGAGLRCSATSEDVSHDDHCFLDSGASHHMFASKDVFWKYRPRSSTVQIADGNSLEAVGEGFVSVRTASGGSINLKALHVPRLSGTLISVCRLRNLGCKVVDASPSDLYIERDGQRLFNTSNIKGTLRIRISVIPAGDPVIQTTRL